MVTVAVSRITNADERAAQQQHDLTVYPNFDADRDRSVEGWKMRIGENPEGRRVRLLRATGSEDVGADKEGSHGEAAK